MIIQIDSREKRNNHIKTVFHEHGVKYFVSKLAVGDYMNYHNPSIAIERKGGLLEVCSNVTAEHERFINELKRARELNTDIIIVVESEEVRQMEDIKAWENPRLKTNTKALKGTTLYKIMRTISTKYGASWAFVQKKYAGAYILNLLSQ